MQAAAEESARGCRLATSNTNCASITSTPNVQFVTDLCCLLFTETCCWPNSTDNFAKLPPKHKLRRHAENQLIGLSRVVSHACFRFSKLHKIATFFANAVRYTRSDATRALLSFPDFFCLSFIIFRFFSVMLCSVLATCVVG